MELALTLACVLMIAAAQILWKIGVTASVAASPQGTTMLLSTVIKLFANIHTLGGTALYVAATGLWFVVLARKPVTLVYPLMALSYVIAPLLAMWLLKERVSTQQWTGIAVIVAGVAIFASSR